ncbi:hypothetical protein [Larkinella sp. C7]|jgi:hypothetical protein|uniref:hypothetical protein n=1 Tax=Larkinella sp. C7 TaxID=2576607 RepID=UPI0011112FA9|nr:hypothetical protein [Larkinella sp. C7]
MKTNAKLMTGLLLTGCLLAPHLYAQTAPDQPNGPEVTTLSPGLAPPAFVQPRPERPGGPGRHPGHRPDRREARGPLGRREGLTALTTVTGTVGQLTGNDDFILNGFTLKNASGSVTTVKFPAHLGQSVQQAVKAGGNVSVTGFSETTPRGENLFRMTSLTAGKTTVTDAPPVALSTPPATPTMSTVTGKIADYQLDREGRVNGLILSTSGDAKTIVRIPSNVVAQLSNLATKGSTITVQGFAKIPHEGQVQLEKATILRASVLTINGQQYLVR